jgi:DNA-binding protein H-NS
VASLKELLAQKEAIEREIERAQKEDRSEAISKIRALMAEYGLTATDLVVKRGPKSSSGKGPRVAAKYRDVATGDTWSGRGLQPRWLKAALSSGRKLTDFAV